MLLKIYQVDAFTDKVFGGNSAAVCPLEKWLDKGQMQQIAAENALAETVFFVPVSNGFEIRWFTPEIEMDLCGHATLAAAHVKSRHMEYPNPTIRFYSASGELSVEVGELQITLNFPSRKPVNSEVPQIILDAFHLQPVDTLKDRDYILVYQSEQDILNLQPDRNILDQINLDPGGVVITAPGTKVDFVSRFFTPQASIFEDPVTGSAHCSLIPYWAERLGKDTMLAEQLSSRKGTLKCSYAGDRVYISGQAVTYMEGIITIQEA